MNCVAAWLRIRAWSNPFGATDSIALSDLPRFLHVWRSTGVAAAVVTALVVPLSLSTGSVASADVLSSRALPNPPFDTSQPTAIPGIVVYAGGQVEGTRYVEQSSCDPTMSGRDGVAWFKQKVLANFGGEDWGSTRECAADGISEHLEGRAWDWRVDVKKPAEFASAGRLLTWLTANNGLEAKRHGIMYIGYNGGLWGAYRASEGWRPINGSNKHTDHVHFSFTWNGATGDVSARTGRVSLDDYGPCRPFVGQPAPLRTGPNRSPCPAAAPLPEHLKGFKLLWRGSNGAEVTALQNQLGVSPANGTFGPATQAAVLAYQRSRGLLVTGAFDAATAYAMKSGGGAPVGHSAKLKKLRPGSKGPKVGALQVTLGITKTDKYGKSTAKAVVVKKKQIKFSNHSKVASVKFQRAIGL